MPAAKGSARTPLGPICCLAHSLIPTDPIPPLYPEESCASLMIPAPVNICRTAGAAAITPHAVHNFKWLPAILSKQTNGQNIVKTKMVLISP